MSPVGTRGLTWSLGTHKYEANVNESNPSASVCVFCGSGDLIRGVRIGQTAEVGNIGPQYRIAFIVNATEPLFSDFCNECGTVSRLYVKNTKRKWNQAS